MDILTMINDNEKKSPEYLPLLKTVEKCINEAKQSLQQQAENRLS